MTYSHTGYKIDKNKSLILLNLHLRDCYTQYKHNRHIKTLRNLTRPTWCRTSVFCTFFPKYKLHNWNEIWSIKDKIESAINERLLTVPGTKVQSLENMVWKGKKIVWRWGN